MDDARSDSPRQLPDGQAGRLRPGSEHYRAYVGPPTQYDFMGATQFRLLCTLGLREWHRLLDFGCGSLRAGRLFVPYLSPGNYFGLEPNRWLIEDGIERQLGQSIIDVKKPVFRHEADFRAEHFGVKFDFILAQSIFSHAGADLIARALNSFRVCLKETGLIVATFVHENIPLGRLEFAGSGWVYADVVAYKPNTIMRFIRDAQLSGGPIPWFHPRQTWYVMARSQEELPAPSNYVHLSGAVLRDPQWRTSY